MTVSVVTGASTGIGFATALRLAREGHEVHASVRSPASGQALVEAAGDLDLSLLLMDVDDDASVAEGIGGVLAETDGVDVLVNNAGIASGHAVAETSMAVFQQAMNTNAWGLLRCIHAVLPSMRERRSGRILNVTSVSGRLAVVSQGAYAMSKWAAEALTEILAAELAPFGIHVSAVEPGVIFTPIFEKAMADPGDPNSPFPGERRMGEWFLQSLVNQPGTPEQVADTIWQAVCADAPKVRYLVGDDAERIDAYRRTITDEQWVAQQSVTDDAEWWRMMTDITGVPSPKA
jgi:NAD(P)-dependent dehydrogenase (short-subunit alcohol dehydrogenase family)